MGLLGVEGTPVLLRIARREVRRHRGRSALVVALIAVPVAVVSCGLAAQATSIPSRAELRAQELGRADLVAGETDDADGRPHEVLEWEEPETVARTLGAALPRGSRVVPVRRTRLDVVSGARATGGIVTATDARDPIHDGRFRVEAGRLPDAEGEAALSPVVAHELGVRVGDPVTLYPGRTRLRVVGLARPTGARLDGTVVVPAATVPATGWWVDLPPGADVDAATDSLRQTPGLNGLPIRTAEAVLEASGLASPPGQDAVWYVVGALCLVWTGVVAAATFAIGARSRLREVGLLAAAGGTERQARRLLLADGLVLGLVGSAVGVAVGLALAVPVLDLLDRYATRDRGAFTVPVLSLLGAGALGTVAAVLAARWPAARAARLPTQAALDGRISRPPRRARATLGGAGTMGLGALLLASGAGSGAEAPIAVGTMLVVAGVAMLHRLLIDLIARLARNAPLALRFVARDASRQASRTGPAVVASMLALAAAVGAATIGATATERIEASPQERGLYPPGRFEVWMEGDDPTTSHIEPTLAPERDGTALAETVSDAVDARRTGVVWTANAPPTARTASSDRLRQGPTVQVATPEALAVLGVDDDTLAAYRRGAALRVDRGVVPSPVTVTDVDGTEHRLPAVDATTGTVGLLGSHAVSPDTAARLGLTHTSMLSVVVDLGRPVSALDSARAHAAALRAGPEGHRIGASTDDQACCDDTFILGAVGVGLGIALPVLGLVAALVRSEAKAELAVLDAVGIAPRRRRRFAAASTGLLAAFASTLALPAGVIPAVLYLRADSSLGPGGSTISLPWAAYAVVLLGAPLILATVGWATAGRARALAAFLP